MRYVSMVLEVPGGTPYETRVTVREPIPKGRILFAMLESDSSEVKMLVSCGGVRNMLPADYEKDGQMGISLNSRAQYFPVDIESQEGDILAIEGWTE